MIYVIIILLIAVIIYQHIYLSNVKADMWEEMNKYKEELVKRGNSE